MTLKDFIVIDLGLVGWVGWGWSLKKASVEELEKTVNWLDDGEKKMEYKGRALYIWMLCM
jgi:hypothetical protein